MKLSIIIPVYNEQDKINSLIADIRSKANCEIIVSDPISTTINTITDKDVTTIISSKGRSFQMNAAAEKATGDVLLYLHADTTLPNDFYHEIEDVMKNYDVGAFRFTLDDSGFMYKLIEKGVWIRNKITKIPYGDQAIFCKKEAFEIIGGYKEIPLMEDVRLMQDFKKAGFKVCLSKKPVITSSRRWKKEGLLFTCIRNWVIITLYYMGVNPHTLKKFYK